MNPEIHSTIENMKKSLPQSYVSLQMTQLLVLLAEETEKQSQILIKQTEQLIRFTRWLVIFTIVLAILTAILILQAFKVLPERKPQLHQGNYDANKSYFCAYKETETERFVTIKTNDIV